MHHRHPLVIAAALAVVTAASAQAQAGTADLRYVQPLPSSVTFTSIDSISNTMGMPTGEMTVTGSVRSVSELRFAPDGDSIVVTATLRELTGAMSTPMGEMPVEAGEAEPVEFRMSATGIDPEEWATTSGGGPQAGASVGDMIGSARALSGLLPLPGRQLRIGESWADTVHATPTVDGTEFEVDVRFSGTYVADTMVDGRHLNVLRFETSLVSELSGTMQGMEVSQKMTSSTSEIVLWDSALHSVVHRDGTTETVTEMYLPQQDMSMNSRGRSRSITTTQPQT